MKLNITLSIHERNTKTISHAYLCNILRARPPRSQATRTSDVPRAPATLKVAVSKKSLKPCLYLSLPVSDGGMTGFIFAVVDLGWILSD